MEKGWERMQKDWEEMEKGLEMEKDWVMRNRAKLCLAEASKPHP